MTIPALSHAQAITLRKETAVSVAVNAVLPPAVIWLLDATPPRVLVGPHDILSVIVPASGLATLLMSVVITLIVRTKVAAGTVPVLVWPRAQRGVFAVLPAWLPLRAVVCALIAIMVFVPLTFAAVALTGVLPLSRYGALVFEVFYGALVGLVMTWIIVLPAMADAKDTGC